MWMEKVGGILQVAKTIVSSPQAKAYVGVKHSVVQKATDLRGEAHRQSYISYL